MSAAAELAGFAPMLAAILIPAGAVLARGEQVADSGRRLAIMARRSRQATRQRREAAAAQADADTEQWLDRIRAVPEDPHTRRALAHRFKEVTP